MKLVMSNENITGVVESKTPSTSTNPKAPAGHFFIDKKKITAWKKENFDAIEEGKSYSLLCSAKQNEYQGKTYTNYSVISAEEEVPLEESDLVIDDMKVLIDESVKKINMPASAINYLKNRLNY